MRMAMQGKNEKFLTTDEAAKLLGVAADTVRQYVWRGTLHAQKFGKQLAFPESECLRYIRENPGPGKPKKKN
jgi:excisionase family DNA binding protein